MTVTHKQKITFSMSGVTDVVVVGLSGASGSGKSSVAAAIEMEWGRRRVRVVEQDRYYRKNVGMEEWERPSGIDWEALMEQVRIAVDSLNGGGGGGGVVVVEGFLVFAHRPLWRCIHLPVSLRCPQLLAQRRRLARDAHPDTLVVDPANTPEYFATHVWPAHLAYLAECEAMEHRALLEFDTEHMPPSQVAKAILGFMTTQREAKMAEQ